MNTVGSIRPFLMDFVTTHINGLSCAIQIIFSSIIKVFRDSKAYFNLFPLDSGVRFGRQIIADAVDVFDFSQDPVGDFVQDRPVQFFDSCSHSVNGIDRTDDHRILEGSGVIAYTDGFKIRYNGSTSLNCRSSGSPPTL